MSGTDYSYNEQGQFFPFFILTVVGIITVPLTYSVLKPSSEPEALAPRIKTNLKPEHADLIQAQRAAQKRRERKVKRGITVVVGWAIMGLMSYLIVVTARTIPKIWNPYDILGITDSASEKEIKSHYRRLSLKFHPDKIRPDPAKNETIENLNDHFVELTKAYKALTDEEIRNNYIQFGHPDGKQSFSIGIALPQFIITEGNGKYVLLVYALLLGVLLPYLVGSWWYGTRRMSKDQVLMESANSLFREYEDGIDEGGVLTALSVGSEFQHLLKGEDAESGLAKVESKILSEDQLSTLGGLSAKDRSSLNNLDEGARRKALALLWNYLGRLELDDSKLNKAKIQVAPIAHALNNSFSSISQAFGSMSSIMAAFHTSQNLVQAIPPKGSPLMQLPHISAAVAKAIEGDSKSHLSLHQYMQLPESYRRKLTIEKGLLTDSEYQSLTAVARQLPRLVVEKTFFKVVGEKHITPGSIVNLVVKVRAIPPGTNEVPGINELDLEDVDPDEDDVEAIVKRKKYGPNGENPDAAKQSLPPLAFAPYFARDHTTRWHCFLSDSKQGRMVVPPTTVTSFDKPLFNAEGKPTFNMQTIKLSFPAPPTAAQYTFCMNLICDSYIGFDTKMEVILNVEEASKAEKINADDEISEPDEDSLAGQMHAMKTGQAPKKKKRPAGDESSEESGTDETDDTSATNTDTDEE